MFNIDNIYPSTPFTASMRHQEFLKSKQELDKVSATTHMDSTPVTPPRHHKINKPKRPPENIPSEIESSLCNQSPQTMQYGRRPHDGETSIRGSWIVDG
eukprot:4953890-Ditylum_brightwellii.AAC.1